LFESWTAVLMAVILLGCGAEGENADVTPVGELGDANVVRSTAPLWEMGEEWSVSDSPQLSIGVLNGSEEYQFVNVTSAARQSDGDLVVVDQAVPAIRLYGPDGVFLRALGGPGSGPGEFLAPQEITISQGDSVWVWDSRLFRITRFDPSGEFNRVETVDLAAVSAAIAPPLFPGPVSPLGDGALLVRLVEKAAVKGSMAPSEVEARPRSGALRVSGDLSTIDTLLFFGDEERVSVEAPWGQQTVPAPFGKRTVITHHVGSSRVCIGDQEGPAITCVGPGGERWLVQWVADSPPPTEAEMEVWRETTVRWFAQKVNENDLRRMLEPVPMPRVRPAYSEIRFDEVGNLWVEIGPSGEPGNSSVENLVFNETGELLGRVFLPPVRVLEIGADYLIGVFRDELEVEYLRLYGLEKGD
jgi:hypothetical protein